MNSAVWDRTMNWLSETGVVSEVELMEDGSTWGTYATSSSTGTMGNIEKNHICDLIGNVLEITTEKDGSGNYVYRGQKYATARSNSGISKGDGFRVTLYIK